ncbi:undecaprenyl/decaprenyl-phosphate alpha-N-acetylglucosaminyl 1-phosphate transferase [Candidatus Saccharibacteria bacterium]|nr:undecaprenyl/decaprenyl-phosphate alpha-N-acetylglucosaminyl 1-phosphate transferase [Candidatus Saccharibacteria bacterium]
MIYFVALVATFALTVLLVPLIKKVAFRVGAVDLPQKNSRKIHTKAMARGGGIAIYIAFVITTFVLVPSHSPEYWGLLFAATAVLIVGFIDDMQSLNPWVKLLVQVIAAVVAFSFFGIRIEAVTSPIGQSLVFTDPNFSFTLANHLVSINLIALLLTTVWLVGMTNTMNFVDGIDGLSGGIAAIAAIIMFFFSPKPWS